VAGLFLHSWHSFYLSHIETASKLGFWFKVKVDKMFQPEEYKEYFED